MKRKLSLLVLWYLRLFAGLQIKKINPLIIGVGGASGKTFFSLSNFISIILKNKYKVGREEAKTAKQEFLWIFWESS